MMVGAELLAAKREAISLPVLVFRDRSLDQIRLQQIESFGFEAATRLESVDLVMFCQSLGIGYMLGGADLAVQLRFRLMRVAPRSLKFSWMTISLLT